MIKKNIFPFFFIISAIESIFSVIWMVSLPADSKNILFFGFSLQRIIAIGGILCVTASFIVLAFLSKTNYKFSTKFESVWTQKWLMLLSFIVTLISWILLFLPEYQWGSFGNYKSRLLPVLTLSFLTGFQTCSMVVICQKRPVWNVIQTILKTQSGLFRHWITLFLCSTFLIFIIMVTRIGLIPDIVYWNDINVPILGIQIIAIILLSIVIDSLLQRISQNQRSYTSGLRKILPELFFFLIIWGIAAVVWTQTTGPRSYFAPGPYPPNNERYPFSDAAGYDLAARLATVGGGLGTQTYVDKPLYVAFLSLIYMIAGSQMKMAVDLQVVVIAIVPAILYLLCKKIHSRLAGFIAAGMIIFREINNINGTLWVLSANSQVLLTESLVLLLLVLAVFFFTNWVSKPDESINLMVSGGFLGLSCLTRLNPFLLVPVALVAIILLHWKNWKRCALYSSIFLVFFSSAVVPWMCQSYVVHGNFLFFISTVRWVVIPQRSFYALNNPLNQQSSSTAPTQQSPVPSTGSGNKNWNKIIGVSRYVSGHFVHNINSMIAIFPTSLELDSLEKTIKDPDSFWSKNWNGVLPTGQAIMFYFNVAVFTLGISLGWKRNRWAGIVPLVFLLSYSLATAAARTSGGRYFFPAEWVGIVYFTMGITQLINWFTDVFLDGKTERISKIEKTHKEIINQPGIKTFGIFFMFLFLGSLPILIDRCIPSRYISLSKTSLISELEKDDLINRFPGGKQELLKFLNNSNSVVYNGLGLYPRFYEINKGEPDQYSEARSLPYPRLVMNVLGPDLMAKGILPVTKISENIPNGSDMIAIGCRGELNDDWYAIILKGTKTQVILREPQSEWTCPARPPECDDNRMCE